MDSIKIQGFVVASDRTNHYGVKFSREALAGMATQESPTPIVWWSGAPAGKVTQFEVNDGYLTVEGEIDVPPEGLNGVSVAPTITDVTYQYDPDTGVTTITDFTLVNFSLVYRAPGDLLSAITVKGQAVPSRYLCKAILHTRAPEPVGVEFELEFPGRPNHVYLEHYIRFYLMETEAELIAYTLTKV